MNIAAAVILGSLVTVMTTAAFAQEQMLPPAGADQQIGAASGPAPRDPGRLPPLFKIGGLPVHVWTPVEPDYNAHANRNLAADRLWGRTW
jgi:hypothetical protein